MAAQSSSGMGYYLGGAKVPNSDAAFYVMPEAVPYMVQGLLSFNEGSLSIQNDSTVTADDHGTMAGGNLVLIETLGKQGVLVTFGGFTHSPGVAIELEDKFLQDPSFQLDFASISVYDIAAGTWYRQNATGDVPKWR